MASGARRCAQPLAHRPHVRRAAVPLVHGVRDEFLAAGRKAASPRRAASKRDTRSGESASPSGSCATPVVHVEKQAGDAAAYAAALEPRAALGSITTVRDVALRALL